MDSLPSSPSQNVLAKSSPNKLFSEGINANLEYNDSPTYPLISVKCQMEPGISPMSELARNLCSTSLGLNPRKLSLSSVNSEDDSPNTSLHARYSDKMDSPMKISPLVDNNSRLLKNALKVTTTTTMTTTPVGIRRGVARRLSQLSRDQDRDENQPPSLITSPNKPLTSPSKFAAVRQISRTRTPLEDYDPNSQDSGISEDSNKSGFRFAEPSGLAPRKLSTTDFSPKRLLTANSNSGSGLSQCSIESVDDGFMDLIHEDKMLEDENAQLPSGMSSLLMQPIIRKDNDNAQSPRCDSPSPRQQITFRRCFSENISLKSTNQTEVFSLKMKRPAVRPPDSPQSKRPRPLTENNTPQRKPAKRTLLDHGFEKKTTPRNKVVASEASIKNALLRSSTEELIGDFSKPYALPLIKGFKNEDLKNITAETLADLIRGKYENDISSYQIIDCRYPYEYEGGHIKGAKNIYTKDQLDKEYMESKSRWNSSSDKRNVLIFHCEFSSSRGPTLSRFLRERDRENNSDSYPALDYPEVYLLNGGYKAFYQNYPELCEPCAYLKMDDPKHQEDLRLFRSKAKSWAGDRKYSKFNRRSSLMRLK